MSQLSIFASGPRIFCDRLDVVADAGGAPHVVGGVIVAGIVDREPLGHHRPGVGEVRQLRLVELLENLRGDLALQEIAGRHHDVVAGLAGQQPRLQRLVGVEGVVDHLDAGLPGEVLQHPRRHVVRPVVEIDRALLRLRGRERQRRRAIAPIRRMRASDSARASVDLLRRVHRVRQALQRGVERCVLLGETEPHHRGHRILLVERRHRDRRDLVVGDDALAERLVGLVEPERRQIDGEEIGALRLEHRKADALQSRWSDGRGSAPDPCASRRNNRRACRGRRRPRPADWARW